MKANKILLAYTLTAFLSCAVSADHEFKTEVNICYSAASDKCVLDLKWPAEAQGFATVVNLHGGGLTGGSWVTALTSDLGNGKFDGGYLVENFENQNPANTLWTKNYNLWSKVDTEGPRFLEFEKWWGGHVNLNGEEIQWIVDQLFVGNHLATGEIVTAAGDRIDLRNIRSPIICFCSKGDNITPPQQALGWIVDDTANGTEVRRA